MNWTKQQAGAAASITSDTHICHRSMFDKDNWWITVSRREPFKALGTAKTWKEAIAMCEADKPMADYDKSVHLEAKRLSDVIDDDIFDLAVKEFGLE